MAPGFGGLNQYLGWLSLMYKVTSKIRFNVLLGGGGTGEYRSVKALVLAYVMQSLLLTLTQIIKLIHTNEKG